MTVGFPGSGRPPPQGTEEGTKEENPQGGGPGKAAYLLMVVEIPMHRYSV